MNLRKTTLAVVALGVTGLASAGMYAPPPAQMAEPVMNNSFYAGIGLGGMAFTNQQTNQGSAAADNGTISANGSGSGSDTDGSIGLNSTLLVGYAWHLPKKMFLGTEVFGNLTNTPLSTNGSATGTVTAGGPVDPTFTGSGTTELTMQSAYGIRALPGYQVSPTAVVYGIAGWTSAHAKGQASSSVEFDTIDVPASATTDKGYNFYGYQLGLGSMINVTEHVAVRGDLIYSGYGKQTIASGSASTDEAISQGSITADPSTLEADVALVYMFD
jgi:opacity protein-like surface antigen